ncbi:MAG: Asp23/Gls24 family envelope stress response protein [Chloroflexi bacterium]|nr:Asp23/Gls24 family envelope stress response protein [Chloroflexota bacterium]
MTDSQVVELSTDMEHSGENSRGTTRIAESVVARIAGMAAREVEGVYDLSDTTLRGALAGAAQKITGTDRKDRGVVVQVGQKEAIVQLNVITLYEASIPEVAAAIRHNVSLRVQGMTGLAVKEINIDVTDMHFPAEERAEAEPRLQ